MVLPPEPKRKQPPNGCVVLLLLVPLGALSYVMTARAAFDVLQAVYWLAIMGAGFSMMQALWGDPRGNLIAWPIVASAYAAAGLDWQGVPFDPWLWRLIDLAAVACIVWIRRWEGVKLSRWDWAICGLMLPAWWAYEQHDYVAYVISAGVVIAQCGLAFAAGRTRAVSARAVDRAPEASE